MKITLSQGVLANKGSKKFDEFANIRKEIESDIIPHKGDFICDSLYGDFDIYEYEVINVIINYTDDSCYVSVAPIIVGNKDLVKRYKKEFAPLHGWK